MEGNGDEGKGCSASAAPKKPPCSFILFQRTKETQEGSSFLDEIMKITSRNGQHDRAEEGYKDRSTLVIQKNLLCKRTLREI